MTDKEEEEEDCQSRICDNVPLRNCRLENKTSCPPTDGGTLGRPKSHAPRTTKKTPLLSRADHQALPLLVSISSL